MHLPLPLLLLLPYWLLAQQNPLPNGSTPGSPVEGKLPAGFRVMIHGGIAAGDHGLGMQGLSAVYRTSLGFEAGLGSSYFGEYTATNNVDRQFISLTADLRQQLSASPSGRFATLIGISAGTGFTLNGDYYDPVANRRMERRNSLVLYPALAFRMHLWRHLGLMLETGYLMDRAPLRDLDAVKSAGHSQWDHFLVRGSLYF